MALRQTKSRVINATDSSPSASAAANRRDLDVPAPVDEVVAPTSAGDADVVAVDSGVCERVAAVTYGVGVTPVLVKPVGKTVEAMDPDGKTVEAMDADGKTVEVMDAVGAEESVTDAVALPEGV